RDHDLVHRQVGTCGTFGRTRGELGEETLVLRFGFGTVPRTERASAPDTILVHVENSTAFVLSGLGNCIFGTRHSNHLRIAGTPENHWLSSPPSRPPGGKLKCFDCKALSAVAGVGIEPTTPRL